MNVSIGEYGEDPLKVVRNSLNFSMLWMVLLLCLGLGVKIKWVLISARRVLKPTVIISEECVFNMESRALFAVTVSFEMCLKHPLSFFISTGVTSFIYQYSIEWTLHIQSTLPNYCTLLLVRTESKWNFKGLQNWKWIWQIPSGQNRFGYLSTWIRGRH